MWNLYLDESGDLGFDFVNKKPSKFFTVTIVATSSYENDRKLAKEVRVTLRRKLNPQGKRKRIVHELKGTNTTLEIKHYFYRRISGIKFGVYSMTLNKRKVYERLTREKERVYNYIARRVPDHIPFEKNEGGPCHAYYRSIEGQTRNRGIQLLYTNPTGSSAQPEHPS